MISTSAPAASETSRSESQFLADQAEMAKKAMVQVWSEMKKGAWWMADIRKLTQNHPWSALGTAAAAGFTTAWVAVPTKEDRIIRRWARINGSKNPPQSPSFFSGLGVEVFKILRPAILSALSASIAAMTTQQEPHDEKSADDPVDASQPL